MTSHSESTSHIDMDRHLMHYSQFRNTLAQKIERLKVTWGAIVRMIASPATYASKEACPLIKLANFGDKRTSKGSLRSDQNMLEVWGVEADYDGEVVTVNAAVQLLARAGIEAVIYTSARNGVFSAGSNGGPRWRVLAPLSRAHSVAERRGLVARLNHVLGNILAEESFTASQTYYFGKVRGVAYESMRSRGHFIDRIEGLAETYPSARSEAKSSAQLTTNSIQVNNQVRTDLTAALRAIATGENYHASLLTLSSSYVATGMAPGAVVNNLRAQMDASAGPRDERWTARKASIPGIVDSAGLKFAPIGEDLELRRRAYQKEENERIGQGTNVVPAAESISLDLALDRFVFLSDGSRVGDVFNPHFDLAYSEWVNTYAASKVPVPRPPTHDGAIRPDRLVPMTGLWRDSPKRKTVVTRTFKAGGTMTLPDPMGKLALNTWRPFDRSLEVVDMQAAGINLFIEHVNFLFPDQNDAERFLDWLAHIEQCPGDLPHRGWLHIAQNYGMGRNWLAGVLTRIWSGAVAANIDLPSMLASGFTGQLSRKVLAIVDEIREGGSDSQWAHAERLKSLITEEQRLINPKFGRQSIEFNACRWLMFSNHLTAIPMDANDRRFEVVVQEGKPKSVDYYAKLYAAQNNPMFIAAVARFLGKRDIRAFKPGAHAEQTQSKMAAAKASQTPMAEKCEMLVEHWPSDIITAQVLYQVMDGRHDDGSLNSAHRRTAEQFGIVPLGRTVKFGQIAKRVSILRNKDIWLCATGAEIAAEAAKAKPYCFGSPSEYLLHRSTLNRSAPDPDPRNDEVESLII